MRNGRNLPLARLQPFEQGCQTITRQKLAPFRRPALLGLWEVGEILVRHLQCHRAGTKAVGDLIGADPQIGAAFRGLGVAQLGLEIEEHQERLKILEEHLESVKMELVHTQSLVDAKNKEIETEEHLKQITERQSGRLKNEIEKLEQRIAD